MKDRILKIIMAVCKPEGVYHIYVRTIKKFRVSIRQLLRICSRIIIVIRLIILGFHSYLMIDFHISPETDTDCLPFIDIGDTIGKSILLVETEVGHDPEGFIPPSDVEKGQVDSICEPAEIPGLPPCIEILVGDLKKRNRPDIPSLNDFNTEVKQIVYRVNRSIKSYEIEKPCIKNIFLRMLKCFG